MDQEERVGEVERIKDPPHFDKLFLALMLRRMQQQRDSGALEANYPHHALDDALAKLDQYVATGNTAFLVDVANQMWIEFMYSGHGAAHFRPIVERDT